MFNAILTAYEIDLLARYLFDMASQRELAIQDRVSLGTISARITSAVGKLEAAGITVPFPSVGRRSAESAGVMRIVDPADMSRLTQAGGGAHGRQRFRWVESSKTERRE